MKVDKVRLGLVFVLVTLIFSILALIYWDFVRDSIIVPIYYLIWVSGLILKSVPQQGYLALLILISVIIGFNTLRGMGSEQLTNRAEANNPQADSRYLHWRRLCARSYASPFSRNQFAWEARRLILSILAYQRGIAPSEAEAMITSSTLDVPDSIRTLVQYKDLPAPRPTPSSVKNTMLRLRQMFLGAHPQNDPQIDSQVAEIVYFIERCLETNRV
jgi:hypothetical protein